MESVEIQNVKIEAINKMLQNGVVNVTFTKKDGSERVMRCTKNLSMVSEEKLPKGYDMNLSNDVFRVYDLDINEWRSFRYDSIKLISIES